MQNQWISFYYTNIANLKGMLFSCSYWQKIWSIDLHRLLFKLAHRQPRHSIQTGIADNRLVLGSDYKVDV